MILWIDPWIKKLWYALIQTDLKIVDAWILKMEEKKFDRVEQYHRMLEIHDFFEEMINNNKIEKLVMERYFITDFNKKNAEFLYWMRGVVMTLAMKNWIEIFEYTPQELKKNITWNPKADKQTVQRFITKIYKLEDIPEFHDAADALWFAFLGTRK